MESPYPMSIANNIAGHLFRNGPDKHYALMYNTILNHFFTWFVVDTHVVALPNVDKFSTLTLGKLAHAMYILFFQQNLSWKNFDIF